MFTFDFAFTPFPLSFARLPDTRIRLRFVAVYHVCYVIYDCSVGSSRFALFVALRYRSHHIRLVCGFTFDRLHILRITVAFTLRCRTTRTFTVTYTVLDVRLRSLHTVPRTFWLHFVVDLLIPRSFPRTALPFVTLLPAHLRITWFYLQCVY